LELNYRATVEKAEQLKEMTKQEATWFFHNPEIQSASDNLIRTANEAIEICDRYAKASRQLINAILPIKGHDPQWIIKIKQLQASAKSTLEVAREEIVGMESQITDIIAGLAIYNNEKNNEMIRTKTQMDSMLQELLSQTLQIGGLASALFSKAIKDWENLLRRSLDPINAELAIQRLNSVAAPTMADLRRLKPEDVETAMGDAHRAIEDIKRLFLSSQVPPAEIRHNINPVQLGIFATLTKARNLHSQKTLDFSI